MKLTVIGTGNMGKALIKGFVGGKVLKGEEITVYDLNKEAANAIASEVGAEVSEDIRKSASESDNILMAVKPQHFDGALAGIKDSIAPTTIVLSIAAAVKTGRIAGILGRNDKLVRIMPNTPAQVGAGVSAVCPVGLTDDEIAFVQKLFATCGEVIVCDEKTLDAIGCVSGTGPAYVMLFIEAMADAAVALGIKRDDALKIAAGTVMGSGKLVLDTGLHPGVLKDQVCSPGGTTIAGVMALEENGLRNAVIKSVIAADLKTKEMSGNK
ncbi:MAG: pyrroline-5-carboxylate reductase [Clostridiales bacterium]|nr:pyrroline-5-carboxylate reductase [Clostridiales bacterium]